MTAEYEVAQMQMFAADKGLEQASCMRAAGCCSAQPVYDKSADRMQTDGQTDKKRSCFF